ncbi:hypothetical protein [Bathymodiolus platifrons methanotrophic gill symbiont]|uniref:hypothetical protein n=1 Tax=Bathymodiolus platifrons methanotrophic gill symbiont TaxID=113268 RepID=UPI001C8E8B95|nr:hypothetical protein [Bathymodiolus platifrons methanotrophic gill symbiont]
MELPCNSSRIINIGKLFRAYSLKYLLTALPKLGRHYKPEALDQFLPWNLTEKIKPLK